MVDLENYRLRLHIFNRLHSCDVFVLLLAFLAATLFASFGQRIYRDYQAFRSLGPGGTPSTFRGYLRVSRLRLYALKNPRDPPENNSGTTNCSSYLLRLPHRFYSRPKVDGIAPHRQIDQKPHPHLHHALRHALLCLANDNTSYLAKGNSCFEKHGLALFFSTMPKPVRPDVAQHPDKTHVGNHHYNKTCKDTAEICHLHPSVRNCTAVYHSTQLLTII